ncbi:SRPBCC family protein [Georgenia alba]|uniref:SRPBCC family protein n=1 Tax=Georgenia alba TaxID=2233858 RepID=A0ABW2QAA4_9MICO
MTTTTGHALELSIPDGQPFIDFTREFDVPVADLYRAHADPDLLAQWLGPRSTTMTVHEFDFRSGGAYRYTHTEGGQEFGFRGCFHTVRENEFLVQTFEFDGFPDVVSIETLTFVDLGGGRSRLAGHSTYPTQEARDGMAASGMEVGMSEGYERLEGLFGTGA